MFLDEYGIYIKLSVREYCVDESKDSQFMTEYFEKFNSFEALREWTKENLIAEPHKNYFYVIGLEGKIHSAPLYNTRTTVLSAQGLHSKINIMEARAKK